MLRWKALAESESSQKEQLARLNKDLEAQLQSYTTGVQTEGREHYWSKETTPARLAALTQAPQVIDGYGDQSHLAPIE